jgi:hypothetical protein
MLWVELSKLLSEFRIKNLYFWVIIKNRNLSHFCAMSRTGCSVTPLNFPLSRHLSRACWISCLWGLEVWLTPRYAWCLRHPQGYGTLRERYQEVGAQGLRPFRTMANATLCYQQTLSRWTPKNKLPNVVGWASCPSLMISRLFGLHHKKFLGIFLIGSP